MKTFIEEVRDGRATLDQVDDWVERWHGDKSNPLELREYLGLNPQEYVEWMKDPNHLRILLAHSE